MQKVWKIREPDIDLKNELARALGASSLFAQLLIHRGVADLAGARHFLDADLKDIHDPFLMKGMKPFIERLGRAIDEKQKVFIATDFDVDGVTSCAILETELKKRGVDVTHYVPHRIKEGYGLSDETVSAARSCGARLFVALDCGITSVREAASLKEAGIDAVIIDHHEPPAILPDAYAILNPKQAGCAYPFKDLASAGLAFKVVQALGAEGLFDYLDLVALGTVADVAPLQGENRIFVRHGLDVLNRTGREGIRALIAAAGIKERRISTHVISFMLAPRLNASGRIDSAHASLDLLLCGDIKEAGRLAGFLNEHNRARQKIEEQVLSEAVEMIEREVDFRDDFTIVLAREGWHPGVLGIVAAKIVDRYYRPAIIISLKGDHGRGSARSVHNFHIYEALTRCREFLKEFGGHKYAAGLSVDRGRIKDFKKALNEAARAAFQDEAFAPVLEADVQIPLSMVTRELMSDIDQLSPYGEGNRRPIFISRHLTIRSKPALVGRNTLKFWVSDGAATLGAVGFGLGDYLGLVKDATHVDLAYQLGWDEWSQEEALQLEVKDIKVS